MKIPDIKLSPQPRLALPAQLHNLQLSQLVGKRLRRPRDVPVNLGLRLRWSMNLQIFLRLLASPSHRVNSRINHQSSRAEPFASQLPEAIIRIAINSQLQSQRFGIKRPAFVVSAVPVKLAEVRQIFQRARQRSLKNMSRHR